jgi:GH15 family glucan-1,4-alpha-glucosidase
VKQSLDLAVIGNSIIGALVDRQAAVVWACMPRLDGDPVFCSLLKPNNGERGFFDVQLDQPVASTQRYLGNTAILTTTLTDESGAAVEITDFMPRFKQYQRIFRPIMLVRRIVPASGNPRIRIRLRPLFGYGTVEPVVTLGSNHVRYQSPAGALRVTTDAPINYITQEVPFFLDEPVHLILSPDEPFAAAIPDTAREFLEKTEDYWNEWVRYLSVPYEWQEAVIRAAITLKLCSFEETGAIVAALTTSIPESPDSGRNWDYRFCWLRDAFFVVQALNRLGATRTMEEFIRYMTNVAAGDNDTILKPLYSIVPGNSVEEHVVGDLAGYRGMGPVRIGNLAAAQVQNDGYGNIVLAAAQMFFDHRLPRRGDVNLFHRLERIGERAALLAFEPDAGLWEFRNSSRVHTFSAVMCWAACDRLAKIATVLDLPGRATHWRQAANNIRGVILERAWNEKLNSFVDSFEDGKIDASLLLLHETGFLAADDPRFLGTVAAVEKQLRRKNHLLRYATPDDFGVPQVAFTVCTFWYIDALAAVGRKAEAREIFEELLACRNHVGLLSEDIDPATGELWGNFPQTYSMVGLIISAMRLSKSWEEAFWRGW